MSITVPLYGFGGGGAPLNFKVVGGLTQPTSPSENTIWVNTDVPITGWYFQTNQPENMAQGEVWFPVGTASAVGFNALKKNSIMVFPTSAKQYDSGAFVSKTAKSYQNNQWNDWIPEFFFRDGVENEQYPINIEKNGNASFEKTENAISLTSSSSTSNTRICAYISSFDVSVIKYIKARIEVEVINGTTIEFAIRKSSIDDVAVVKSTANATGTHVLELDVSTYSGTHYITLSTGNGGMNARYAKFNILEWWVELDENNIAISELEAAYQEGVNAAYDQ